MPRKQNFEIQDAIVQSTLDQQHVSVDHLTGHLHHSWLNRSNRRTIAVDFD